MTDVGAFLKGLEVLIEGEPTAGELREIRDVLDDPAFARALKEYIRSINDPDVLSAVLTRMRRIRRNSEEKCEKRKLHKDLVIQLGVTGGVGLIGGSIVAAATAAIPLIALIPVAGGIWMAFQGFTSSSRLDEERHLFDQIASLMKPLIEGIQ